MCFLYVHQNHHEVGDVSVIGGHSTDVVEDLDERIEWWSDGAAEDEDEWPWTPLEVEKTSRDAVHTDDVGVKRGTADTDWHANLDQDGLVDCLPRPVIENHLCTHD